VRPRTCHSSLLTLNIEEKQTKTAIPGTRLRVKPGNKQEL
jgi:hypothetical protein